MSLAQPQLILASTSPTRRQILSNAGINFTAQSPNFDEDTYKLKHPNVTAAELAIGLAQEKALAIKDPKALIIGADQTLSCGGTIYSKPNSLADARRHLLQLRGNTHILCTALAIAQSGQIIFTTCETANLTMTKFSNAFLENYLETTNDHILGTVGCYELEKQGVQLFDKIEGDYFTILGFPLLSCLAFLREIKFLNV